MKRSASASVSATGAGVPALRRIGEAAELTGVSERTLRYYEQVGLVAPTSYSAGGIRLYGDAEIARVQRIRELQSLMGFNLDEIRTVLHAEDRLGELRAEYREVDPVRQQELLVEALVTVTDLQDKIRGKLERLQHALAELDARAAKYRKLIRRPSSG